MKNFIKQKSQLVWDASPAGSSYAPDKDPGSPEFFSTVLSKRSTYEMPWLFALVPFDQMQDKRILELGCGAGYDAYAFCKNQASYVGIDLAPENPKRVRAHLAPYGFSPEVIVGDAENLMFPDNNFDVVFSNGVLHHTPDIRNSFREAYRVLRSNGKFWVIVYHKNSIFYWLSLFLYEHIFCFGWRKSSMKDRLSRIEYTTSDARPLVNVYTRSQLSNLLEREGFLVDRVSIRKLTREDLPQLPILHHAYRFIPQSFLDLIGKQFGWYLIACAVK